MGKSNFEADRRMRRRDNFRKLMKEKMATRYTQGQLGKKMGLGQSAISAGIKNCSFNFDDLGKIFELLEFTEEDIIKVMRG